jgi:hypothetical protein
MFFLTSGAVTFTNYLSPAFDKIFNKNIITFAEIIIKILSGFFIQ